MNSKIILMIKGMLIGIGKVIPGVSGSLIAVSLGIYEQAMNAIGHFFTHMKENIVFLGTLSIGILISIVLGSQFIVYLLEFWYVPTMFLFIGFIAGAIPNLYEKINYKNKHMWFCFCLAVLFLFCLQFFSTHADFVPQKTFSSYFIIMGIGFLDAATMIIPGISGTAVFMILGCYSFVLNLFASASNLYYILSHFAYFFFFGIGLIIGIFIVSRIMSYFFSQYKQPTYAFIIGFTISSILLLLQKVIQYGTSLGECFLGCLLTVIGYWISTKFGDD